MLTEVDSCQKLILLNRQNKYHYYFMLIFQGKMYIHIFGNDTEIILNVIIDTV